jgi:glutathione S-transferase
MSQAETITLYRPEYESIRLIQCSPPSWMVEMTLAEKGLGFVLERLSFARGEHKTPAMLERNPRGTIPVLTVGQAVLTETLAMLEYLDLRYPEPALMGRDPLSRARALDRLHESAAIKRIGMDLLAYLMRTPDSQRDPERVAGGLDALRQELSWWQRTYSASAWAAGDSISLADISVFSYVATFVQLGLDLGPLPALAAFHARMRERPSVQATWPEPWKTAEPGDALAGQ